MSTKPLTPTACLLALAALALPACGGDDASDARPAAGSVPPEQVEGVEKRVGDLEKEIIKLRRDLEGMRDDQSSAEEAGSDEAGADPSAGATGAAGGVAGAGASAGGGSGSGSGSGGGSGSRGGSGADRDVGGGPDPGTTEDDPGIKDICGENPAPTC